MLTLIQEKAMRALDLLRIRSRDYRLAFSTVPAQNVLIDLAKFCRANETCFQADPRMHAVLEGRREVWLRLMNHIRLNPEELYAIYEGRNFNLAVEKTDD